MGRKKLFNENEKWCSRCSRWRSLVSFWVNKKTASGRQDYCIDCQTKCQRQSSYDLSPEEFQKFWDAQKGLCAICLRRRKLCVDHDHRTNIVRGLLCITCNAMLGALGENPVSFERAIRYLKADYTLQL